MSRLPIVGVVLALLVVCACGNRLSHQEVVAAATAGRISAGGAQSGAGGPAAPVGPGGVTATTTAAGGANGPSGGGASGPTGTVLSGGGSEASSPGAPGAPAANLSMVTIGNIGTYSGIIGALFASGQQMALIWAKWVNAHGGLNGHPVRVITADDGGDPGRYLSEVKDMVENQHVIAFMGNLVPLSASGPEQYLEQHHIPVIGGDSTSDIWFNSPVLFPDATRFEAFSPAAAREAVAEGKPKVSIIWCAEVPACHTWNNSLQGGAAAKQGATVVYSGQVSLAQPDFTSECLQSQSHGAQAILAAVDANSLVRLSRDCAQQGYHPLYVAVSLAVINQVATDPNLNGLVAPQGTFPWPADDTPATQDYQAAINQFAPGLQGSGASASVWTSGVLFQKAAAALPANPTTNDLFAGLWKIKNDTLGGLAPPITYTKGGLPSGSNCFFLVRVSGGKWIAPNGSRSQCLS